MSEIGVTSDMALSIFESAQPTNPVAAKKQSNPPLYSTAAFLYFAAYGLKKQA